MFRTFTLTFADGYKVTVIGTFDEMIGKLDAHVQKHGDCSSCVEEISYNKYTGTKVNVIW